MKKNIYIIIVTYNAMNWLQQCIESCDNHSIVIVDNCSTDSTLNYIEKNHSEIILFKQTKNLGFGAANNVGISHAISQDADYVFLLNQDAYLEKNTIENLIEIHHENKEFGIVSPVHLNGRGASLDFNFSNYIRQNRQFQFDTLKQDFKKSIYELPFVNAAAWLLPVSTFKLIGGFDSMFFHYGEDDNYCQRVLYHGLKIGVVPTIFIKHDRENRVKAKEKTTKQILQDLELSLKINWGNINNNNFDVEYNLRSKSLKEKIFKSLIKCNFKKATLYNKELKLIHKIQLEIENSRLNNLRIK